MQILPSSSAPLLLPKAVSRLAPAPVPAEPEALVQDSLARAHAPSNVAAPAARVSAASLVSSAAVGSTRVLAMIAPGVIGSVALNETEECFKCHGTGKCQQDWPAGSGLRSTGQKCSSCNGTGECPQCGGTGRWMLVHPPSHSSQAA